MVMLVLMPDVQFEDDAEIEREVLGDLAEIGIHRELVADRIPDELWRGAEVLIVYYGVPVDRSLIERLDSCRLVVRAGVGYDHIDVTTCAARGSCRSAWAPPRKGEMLAGGISGQGQSRILRDARRQPVFSNGPMAQRS